MTIQVYFEKGKCFKTEAAPSIVTEEMLRGFAYLTGASYCTCLAKFGTKLFYAAEWKGGRAVKHSSTHSSTFIETPFGDFQLTRTDLSKGSSCSQCAILNSGHCHEVSCTDFDNDRHHFHFVRRYEE